MNIKKSDTYFSSDLFLVSEYEVLMETSGDDGLIPQTSRLTN